MREIKFRFWYSNERHTFSEVFSLTEVMNGDPFEVLSHEPLMSGYKMLEVIEQYTGLKDCNGVEIYEGDICKP